jgi:hypothetical protein
MREARSSPPAHRSARVIGTDALDILLVSPEPSDGEEHKQDAKDDPNINTHQSGPTAGSHPTQGADRVSAPTRRCEARRAGTCHDPLGGRSWPTDQRRSCRLVRCAHRHTDRQRKPRACRGF